jgi:regulatory protein
MAGTVTKLEIQKRNKERVNVYLDDDYAFAVTLTVALALKKGQFLSDSEIADFKAGDDRHKAYDRALHFLGFRARSRTEMERYLRKKKYSEDVISETVKRLVSEEYLDDKAFAQSWVENRERLKPKSSRALQYELRQKGVSEAAIESALQELDEDDAAWRALESKLWQWQQLDEDSFKKKAGAFLGRRGFGYDVSRDVIERAWQTITADGGEL